MTGNRLTNGAFSAIRQNMKRTRIYASFAITGLALTGCVQVAAPDKPIVINLNIRIEQEVIYKIDGAVQSAIEDNADIF